MVADVATKQLDKEYRETGKIPTLEQRVRSSYEEYPTDLEEHILDFAEKHDRRPEQREFSLVTVHMDWYHNDHDQWCLAIEDNASWYVFDMIKIDRWSAARGFDLLETVRHNAEPDIPIM